MELCSALRNFRELDLLNLVNSKSQARDQPSTPICVDSSSGSRSNVIPMENRSMSMVHMPRFPVQCAPEKILPQINHVLYISPAPATPGWLNDGRSYVPPVGIGEV